MLVLLVPLLMVVVVMLSVLDLVIHRESALLRPVVAAITAQAMVKHMLEAMAVVDTVMDEEDVVVVMVTSITRT